MIAIRTLCAGLLCAAATLLAGCGGATVLYPAAITRFEGGSEADLDAGRRVQVRGVLSPDRTRLVALGIRFIE